jgi:hypothetical protein
MCFVFAVQGEYVNRWLFQRKITSGGEIILLGLIFQTIIATMVAFFCRIHIEYFCCNTLFTLVLAFGDKNWLRRLKQGFQWDLFCTVLFGIIVLLSLMRSSMLPFIIDNESYYIQTTKWLNEYGWVKGLANLHVFLAQGTPWHVLQAAYNFNFIYGIFNDLNGFLVCVVSFIWINKINELRQKADYQTNRWLFFLPLFTVLWFQFVDSPSPDLPLILLTLVVAYHILNQSDVGNLFAILLLVFLVFIKITIAPVLVLLPFLLTKKNWKIALAYSFTLGILYILKGIWLSGCPFAPYTGFSLPFSWTIPSGLTILFAGDRFNFRSIGSNDLLDLGFAFLTIFTAIIYLGMVWKKRKHYPLLLFLFLDILLILFIYSLFRYIFPALFFPLAFVLSKIKLPPRVLSILIYFFILLAFVPLFTSLDYGKINRYSNLLKVDIFQAKYILKPAGITKYDDLSFDKKTCTNFDYFDPMDQSKFIFLTGNGQIPCVKTNYLRYMYAKTGCLPALFDENDLGKGFYSINNNSDP